MNLVCTYNDWFIKFDDDKNIKHREKFIMIGCEEEILKLKF